MKVEKQAEEIAEYLELRKRREFLRREYERLDSELLDKQNEIERAFIGLLKNTGGSISLPVGRATHSIKTKMQVGDAAAFYEYIAEDPTNRLCLLQRRIAPRNHDEYCSGVGVSELPGVNYEKHHAVTFYKSTKTKTKGK